MKKQKSLLALTAIATVVSGCASQQPTFVAKPSGIHSRQVALMPYNNQGVTVAGGTTWYYGEGNGIRAFPAQGGIVYVVTGEENIINELARQKAEKEKQAQKAMQATANAESLNESSTSEVEGSAAVVSPVPDIGVKPIPVSSTVKSAFVADENGRLKLASTNEPKPEQAPVSEVSENETDASLYCGGQASKNGIPLDMQDKDLLVRVHFKFNSSRSMYQTSNNVLGAVLADSAPSKRLHIIGYTDDRGNDSVNNVISKKRADHVKAQIKKRWPNVTVTTEGRGSCPRFAENASDEGRKLNRRAEVYVF